MVFLHARESDRDVPGLDSDLHDMRIIVVIFLEFFEIVPKVRFPCSGRTSADFLLQEVSRVPR